MRRTFTLFFSLITTIALAQPVITLNPLDGSFCEDGCANFEANAVGDGVEFEWFVTDGSNPGVSVSTGASILLCDSIIQYDGMLFYCVATDMNGEQAFTDSALASVSECLPPVADFSYTWNQLEICFENTSQNAETVIWLFGDGTSDATNVQAPCHTYATSELYFVKLRAFNEHGEDVIQRPINPLGLDEEESSEMSVFPNPANEVLNIQSDKAIEGLRLMDLSGQLLYTTSKSATSYSLDLRSYDAGVYFLLWQVDGKAMQERIVIR